MNQQADNINAVKTTQIFLVGAITGLVMGVGFLMSGMSDPSIVLAFLNLTGFVNGQWDPRLALVMVGALLVTFPAYRWVLPRLSQPLCAQRFNWPTKTHIDKPLVIGSLLFGLGWGLIGVCPGPALSVLLSFQTEAWVVFGGLVSGLLIARALSASIGRK